MVLPFVGVLIFLVAHGMGMAERRCGDATAARAQVDRLVRWVVRTGGPGDEIVKAETLLDKGAITQAGFDAIRVKALS